MGDATFKQVQRERYAVEFRDILTALIKEYDIHDGIWRLTFQFDLSGMSVRWKGDTAEHTRPAALVCATNCWIVKVTEEDATAVDAAKVNPRPDPSLPNDGLPAKPSVN